MNCVGVLPDGGLLALPAPVRLRLRSEEGAPADSLEARFPAFPGVGTLCGVRCYGDDGALLFDGIVDEQAGEETAAGAVAELSARSRAALLLDNEARPQTYYMPSLKLLFERHAAPYGFTGYLGRDEVFGGAYTVEKGMSEWQALEGFCKKYLGVSPVARGAVLDASGAGQAGQMAFSNAGGVPFLEMRTAWKDVYRLSELRMRSGGQGNYTAVLQDADALARGVKRRRFLSGADAERAERLLEQVRKKAFAVQVTCPGAVCPLVGTTARVDGREGLYVSAWDYVLSGAGETCKVTLRQKEDN